MKIKDDSEEKEDLQWEKRGTVFCYNILKVEDTENKNEMFALLQNIERGSDHTAYP